jgi:Plant transposon protein
MWFWHAAYGFAGTLNDINVLNSSPWFGSLIDGSFHKLEESVVPFQIHDESFDKMYVLVDGIYPKYARFVQGLTSPVGIKQKKYTGWQEACRKDIERAFALLQGKWQCTARPMYQIELKNVGNGMAACLILHSMGVADRVMDDVRAVYDPASSIVNDESIIEYMPDMMERQGHTSAEDR